jgi:HEAT repeat protein
MSESVESPELPNTEHPADLPEVQPPTAGFIVQLFGIPLAIVAVAVLVWLLFGKIASSHQSPAEYMQDLRSPNFERRWSAARDLASILPHNAQWQNDQEFAAELANELESELIDGPSGPQEIRYVHFIAEALGEFRSEAGIPALRKALSREVDRDVREAAVMGLGKLAGRLDGLHDPDAIDDLVATARDDDDPTIRVKATWILGRTRNERAINGLTSLVNDGDPEVRLNAAASLASLGSTAGLETLAEMLDSNQLRQSLQARGLGSPQVESQLVAIPLSALQSLSLLLENLPSADLEPLRHDVEALANHGNRRIQISAKDLLIKMNSDRSKN